LSDQSQKSGVIVSGLLHGALLAAIIVGFSGAPKFDDASESVPVETVTQSQFNEIMKGEKDAKPDKPVEKPAQPPEAAAPKPVVEPPPPPPPQKAEEPKPEPPAPPQREAEAKPEPPAPTPPMRPPPAPPLRPATSVPTPPPPPDAEVDRQQAKADPQPTPPSPPMRPKPVEKPKQDQLAKLMDDKNEDQPKPPAKPKSSDTPNDRHTFDVNSIAKMLGQGKPRNLEQEANLAPQGTTTGSAQRMSPSMSAALDDWLIDAYLNCWTPPPAMPEGAKYEAQIKVAFNADGTLSMRPQLINPPSDPAWRPYAESAMRAVLKCNPLQVPPQYAPYFEQWRTKTIHFDPDKALG
jgi:colicin import membrane protein